VVKTKNWIATVVHENQVMRIKSLSLAAAFLALSAFTPRDVAASGAEIAPLRIAVFVGGGARNIGAFR
jgi:hypothetical protein